MEDMHTCPMMRGGDLLDTSAARLPSWLEGSSWINKTAAIHELDSVTIRKCSLQMDDNEQKWGKWNRQGNTIIEHQEITQETGWIIETHSNNGGQKKTELYAHPELEPMVHQRPRPMACQPVNSFLVCGTAQLSNLSYQNYSGPGVTTLELSMNHKEVCIAP